MVSKMGKTYNIRNMKQLKKVLADIIKKSGKQAFGNENYNVKVQVKECKD